MLKRVSAAGLVSVVMLVALEGFAGIHPRVEHLEIEADPSTEAGRPGVNARVDRLHAVLAHDGKLYAIEDHFVYVSRDTGSTYSVLGQLPDAGGGTLVDRLRELVARSAITRKLRRYSGPKGMVILSTGTMLVFYDQIYRSEDGGRTFVALPDTDADHLPGGFPSSVGYAVGDGDTIYYGEYVTTPRPHEVRIVRGTDDGTRWSVVHRFPPGEHFHVHSIAYDRFRDRFWVAVGDEEDEPALLYTDDHFDTLVRVGCCAQEWRMVDLIVTRGALYWGSDDDRSNPGIFRYDIDAQHLERVADLPNPSYHAARVADGWMAISTTYEPTSPYTRREDPPARTALWVSKDGRKWERAIALPGDSAAYSAGSRPHIQLPAGDPLPALFATPWFTETDEFVTLRFDRME